MVLWWIGNALLAFVVAPLVIFLANRLVRLALEVRNYADDVLQNGVDLTAALDAVPNLVETEELTGAAKQAVGRYGAALVALGSLPAASTEEAGSDASASPARPAPRQRRGRLTAARES